MTFWDKNNFVHLHVHSHYSTLDGAIRMKDLTRKAAEANMPAMAVTDHGNMFGALDFQEEADAAGIKPIFGCEFYLAKKTLNDRVPKEKPFHLLALAENETGYKNLCKLVSISYIEGFYYKPRIDKETLAAHSEGLILGSACLGGEIPRLLVEDRYEQARNTAAAYEEIAGKGNFYLEVMDHGLKEQKKVNKGLVSISREIGIPLLATNDAHFLNQDDHEAHEILLCLQTGKKLADPGRFRMESNQFYLKTPEEMHSLFGEIPDSLHNTLEVAARCNARIETVKTPEHERKEPKYKIPQFSIPEGETETEHLRSLCEAGLGKRYPEITDELTKRLEYELGIIQEMGFSGYFLIVQDLVNYAKTHGIPVGPGRGSAAGSLVSYSLGITNLDPLKYDLFFERFLNPARISMPDIDIDFCVERRGQVIEYIRERYGSPQVAQIITYSYMKAKAVIKDVGRVLGFDFGESNRISGFITDDSKNLADAFNNSEELRQLRQQGGEYEKLFRNALKLENIIRHVSVHAAGVVISPKPLVNYIPLYRDNKTGIIVSQFDGPHLEDVGLLKMDILGLKNLTTMEECRRLIRDRQGIELDFDSFSASIEDPEAKKTYQLLQSGHSLGIFQLESEGMQQLLKNLRPESFEEIISLIALYRPGPLNMGMHNKFVDRKHGKEQITYPLKELEPILKDTYGIIVYQEQVMQISRVIGGFSMAEADNLRKAMGKKKDEIINKLEKKFLDGAHKNGIDVNRARELYDLMRQFGQYGFNKSHSAAYAIISYQTAYLKANYTLEYLAALMTSEREDLDKLALIIQEARDMEITVLPPDVNFSQVYFSVEEKNIRFGLSALKGVGESAAEAIVSARASHPFFADLLDFCKSVDLGTVKKRAIEFLIKSGAFSSTGKKRSVLFHSLENTITQAANIQKDIASGQGNFFNLFEQQERSTEELLEHDLEEWNDQQLFAFEKELLGTYISGHPLDHYRKTINRLFSQNSKHSSSFHDKQRVRLPGIIRSLEERTTSRGQPMATVFLEDFYGETKIFFFSEALENNRNDLYEGNMVMIQLEARKPYMRENITLYGEKVVPLSGLHIKDLHIYLRSNNPGKDELFRIREELIDSRNRGNSPVYFHVPASGSPLTIRASQDITVDPSQRLIEFLKAATVVQSVTLE